MLKIRLLGFVYLTVFVEKLNKRLEFTKHILVSAEHNHIMVYSNAMYFASKFDKLADELFTSVKQKAITKKVQCCN